MKRVLLLRHGQSTLNLGLAEEDYSLAPLTEEGIKQAEKASYDLPFEPELIASSPYLRAIQTAEPIRKRFPEATWEQWNELHEFTYLEPASCTGLTKDERRPRILEGNRSGLCRWERCGELSDAHASCGHCFGTLT